MKKIIIIGSGAGGATAAKELQGDFEVTVLEEGGEFQPFPYNLNLLGRLKRTGVYFDPRQIQLLFPAMKISRTSDNMVVVNGKGVGGATTLSAGNALRMDQDLKKIGIDLDNEFAELYEEIPVTNNHQNLWQKPTQQLFQICREMGLKPEPLPKFGDYRKCINCGQCVLGCRSGAKWDSRSFLNLAVDKGARLITGCKAEKILTENGKVTGVIAKKNFQKKFFPADLVILAAGGLGTPLVLKNSGFPCREQLFIDPVLCIAAEWKDAHQNNELSMPFYVKREGYIISPYFDHLSYFFNRDWRYLAQNILSLMIKLADSNQGFINRQKITKQLSDTDHQRLTEGTKLCQNILEEMGIERSQMFKGLLNAGHPGGMFPLSEKEAETLHHQFLPDNLYIADASLLPVSLGAPPILTIMALAKRVSKIINRKNH